MAKEGSQAMTNWAALDVAIGIIVVFFVLSLLASTVNESIATALGWRAGYLEGVIEAFPNAEVGKVVTTLLEDVRGEEQRLRQRVERWYDDAMERVSGWYKRRVQVALALIGLVVAITLNADTLQIVRTLWVD